MRMLYQVRLGAETDNPIRHGKIDKPKGRHLPKQELRSIDHRQVHPFNRVPCLQKHCLQPFNNISGTPSNEGNYR